MISIDLSWPPGLPRAIVLTRILQGQSALLLVTHDEDDGTWQFLDGEHVFEEDAIAASFDNMAVFDPSVAELTDLPPGWYARRAAPGEPWQRAPGEPPVAR